MKRILYILLGLLVFSCISILGFHILRADTPLPALIVHPSNFDLTLVPGSSSSGTIYLMNTTKTIFTIQTKPQNFSAQGEEGSVNLTAQDTSFALASWIKVSPEKTVIPPGKEVGFTYTITPPLNAEPGGHFGAIVFATVPSKNTVGGAGAAVSEEIAALILARIPGNVKEEARILSLTTDRKFYEFGPVYFSMRVANTGAVHIQPFGAIQISDMFGRVFDAPIQRYNVLPGATRKISVVFPEHLLIGKYTATIIASYGDKNLPLSGTVVFYAFPIRYALVLLLTLFILFLFRRRIGKAMKMIITGK